MSFVKPLVLGLGLVTVAALGAQAQTAAVNPGPSVASLPPIDQGPRTASHNTVQGDRPSAIAPSGGYPGPAAGSSTGVMPPHYDKPADWDRNASMHPYDKGQTPAPN